MAAADDDTDTRTAPPPPTTPPPTTGVSPDVLAQLGPLLQQFMPQPVQQDTTPVSRSWTSLLGQALAGGPPVAGMTDTDKEIAGHQALMQFGTGLMAASRYQPGQTLFSNLAGGFQGAQRGEIGAEEMAMAKLGAQQDYQQQQVQNKLAALKEALPILTLKTQMDQAAAARNLAGGGGAPGGGGPPAPNVAQGGSIATVARDPSVPTAGQQGNNSGNLMADNSLPPGAIGRIPVAGGRFVAAFPDVPTGVAAQSDNLAAYKAAGVQTIRQAVNRWVGDPKANTDSYAADVAKAAGVDPDAPVDLSDPKIQRAFLLAQQPHESGKSWLAPADVDKGLALAATRRAAPPGGSKTAGGPPAPTTAITPPAATVAAPGGGFGAFAFNAPSRTVMPAPASQADAPNTTDTLPPVPTPQMAAARALAVKAGRPMPIAGSDGLFANPDGSVGSGPNAGGISGKRADISPIVQGMQTAQTTMPPGVATAAGPAAPIAGVTTPTVSPPAPASAFGGGAFTTAPARTIGAPAAPAPQVTPQATPPVVTPPVAGGPAAPTPPTAGGRDFDVNQPFAYKPGALPTTEDFNPHLTPAQQAAFDLRRQQIATLPFAQQPEAYANLTGAVQDATQSKAQAAAAAATKYQETEKQQQFDAWKQLQKQASDERLAQIQSGNTVTQERAKAQFGVESTQLNNINKAADAARDKAGELDVMQALSNAAGSADPIGQIKIGDHTIAQLLSNYGWGNEADLNKLTAEQALTLASQKYGMDMRSGQGMGRLTNQELTFVQNMVPNPGQRPDTRNAMIAYLRVQQQRQLDYAGEVNRLWSKGVSLPDAQEQAEKTLGPTLKQMPSNLNDPSPQGATNTYGWMRSNGIAPGTFYKRWDGRLMISPQTYPEQ